MRTRKSTAVHKRRQETSSRSLDLVASTAQDSADAIITKDLDCNVTSWNKGAQKIFGYAPDEIIGCPISILVPPDRLSEEVTNHERVRAGQCVEPYETVRLRKGGEPIEILMSMAPLIDTQGQIVGALKIARDFTAWKQDTELQKLVIREMDHRLKNLFAIINSLVSLSANSEKMPVSLTESIRARIGALARAYTVGTSAPAKRARSNLITLRELLRKILDPYTGARSGEVRVAIAGANIPIGSRALTEFALVLNELATNSAKYGALSRPDGRLEIRSAARDSELVLDWAEHAAGLPEAGQAGFGSVLLKELVVRQLGGQLTYDWTEHGLTAKLSVPLARLDAPSGNAD